MLELRGMESLGRIRSLVQACHARLGRPLTPDDLEDVVQSTAIAAWSRQGSFGGRSSVETWIYGIARLEILESMRRRTRTERLHQSAGEHAERRPPTVPGEAVESDFRQRINSLVQGLGTTVATILRQRLVDGASFKEIGDDLGLSESNAKARFHRVLPRAQKRLARLRDALRRGG